MCPAKKEARQLAKGWRSPSQPRRESRATAPPKGESLEGLVTEEDGEMEVEMQSRAASETWE